MTKEYLTDINNSIRTIVVTYMGRTVVAEVTGFLKLNGETVARISVRNSNYRNKNDYLVSLSRGTGIHHPKLMMVDHDNLILLNQLCDDYYVVRSIIDS